MTEVLGGRLIVDKSVTVEFGSRVLDSGTGGGAIFYLSEIEHRLLCDQVHGLSICRGMDPNAQKQQALWLRQNALASINKSISGSTLSTLAHDNIAAVAMELVSKRRLQWTCTR